MSSKPVYAWAWLYIDGNIREDESHGYSYDLPIAKYMKLDVTLTYKQLCDNLCAKLNIDQNLYQLKIMHRCLNLQNNKYGVAPIVDDDDVELMFEMVLSFGVKTCVELYLEKIPIVSVECGNGRAESSRINEIGVEAEQLEVSHDGESGDSNKRTLYMQRVDDRGVPLGSPEFKDNGIPMYRSFDGSRMVVSFKEPAFTMIGDVLDVTDLKKGMVFSSKEELAEIVHEVHHRNHMGIRVIRSNAVRWNAGCKQKESGCAWTLKATKRQRHGFFEIMKTPGPHTCVNPTITEEPATLHCSDVVDVMEPQVAADP